MDTALAVLVALSLPLWLVFEALHQYLTRFRRRAPAERKRRADVPVRSTTREVRERTQAFSRAHTM